MRETRRGWVDGGDGGGGTTILFPVPIEFNTPLGIVESPVPPATRSPPTSIGGGAIGSSICRTCLGTKRGATTLPSDARLLAVWWVLRTAAGASGAGGGVGAMSEEIN